MSSQFDGMNLREMRDFPMTGEATGMLMSYWFPNRRWRQHPLQLRICLTQERYVREVRLRCPRWRFRKRKKLAGGLRLVEAITNLTLCASRLSIGQCKESKKWEPMSPTDVRDYRKVAGLEPERIVGTFEGPVVSTLAGERGCELRAEDRRDAIVEGERSPT